MTLNETIQAAKQGNEAAFADVPEKRVLAIVRAVLNEVNRQVREAQEGQVILAGFGRFVVKEKEIEKDGEKVMKRRVLFRAAPLKASKAPAATAKQAKAGRVRRAAKTGE